VSPDKVASVLVRRDPVSAETLAQSRQIVDAVREGGEEALLRFGVQFKELERGQPYVLGREELRAVRRLPLSSSCLRRSRSCACVRALPR
jgi:histidinol dehydrogenase